MSDFANCIVTKTPVEQMPQYPVFTADLNLAAGILEEMELPRLDREGPTPADTDMRLRVVSHDPNDEQMNHEVELCIPVSLDFLADIQHMIKTFS